MNVVIVNDYAFVNGGASKVALGSAKALRDAKHSVHLFAGVGPVAEDLTGIRVECLERTPYNKQGSSPAVMKAGLWDSSAALKLREFLEPLDPGDTVVHVHTNRDALSASVIGEARTLGFPVVYSCHEYNLGCPYGAFYNQRASCICPRRGLSLGCLTTKCNEGPYVRKLYSFLRQAVHVKGGGVPGKMSAVVFVSEFSKRILQPYVPEGVRTLIIRNPVEVEPGLTHEVSAESPFVFVGTLNSGKDPALAAKAANLAEAPIVFVGEGDQREAIMQANGEARITGWLAKPDLIEVLRTARALVLPARWYETQGLVVQEAAAAGVPAIVSDTCAAGESIVEGENGYLFKSGDAEGLAANMRLLMDDSTAKRMGSEAASRFWSDPPTMQRHVESLESLYKEVLK